MRWKASAVENVDNLDRLRERRGARERVAFQSQALVISQVTCNGRGRAPGALEIWLESVAMGDEIQSKAESLAGGCRSTESDIGESDIDDFDTAGFDTFGMGRC